MFCFLGQRCKKNICYSWWGVFTSIWWFLSTKISEAPFVFRFLWIINLYMVFYKVAKLWTKACRILLRWHDLHLHIIKWHKFWEERKFQICRYWVCNNCVLWYVCCDICWIDLGVGFRLSLKNKGTRTALALKMNGAYLTFRENQVITSINIHIIVWHQILSKQFILHNFLLFLNFIKIIINFIFNFFFECKFYI